MPGDQAEVLLGRATTTLGAASTRVRSSRSTSADTSGAGMRVIRDGRVGFAHCGSLDPDGARRHAGRGPRQLRRSVRSTSSPGWRSPTVSRWWPATRGPWRWSPTRSSTRSTPRSSWSVGCSASTRGSPGRGAPCSPTGWAESAIVSSAGIAAADRSASCSVATQPLARHDGATQTGFAHDAGRDPSSLDLERVATEAVDRATRLLGATKPGSGRLTIVLEPRLALTLLGIVSGMLSGDVVVKGRSPFGDRVGEQIASPLLHLTDDPTRSESLGSRRSTARVWPVVQRTDRRWSAGGVPA